MVMTFKVKCFNESEVVLKNSKDLQILFDSLEQEENVILSWNDEGVEKSQLVIATNISSKVKNGEITLKSMEEN